METEISQRAKQWIKDLVIPAEAFVFRHLFVGHGTLLKALLEDQKLSQTLHLLQAEKGLKVPAQNGVPGIYCSRSNAHSSLSIRHGFNPREEKSVLMVFPYSLMPTQSGGASRALSVIRALKEEGYRVILLCVDQNVLHWSKVFDEVDAMAVLDRKGWSQAWDQQPDTSLTARYHPALGDEVESLCRLFNPKAVIANFAYTAFALNKVPAGILKLVDTHDVQHRRSENAAENDGQLHDRLCSEKAEKEALSHADAVIAIQPDEQKMLQEMLPDHKVVLAGHAVSEITQLKAPAESRRIMFVGNNYDPNNRGIAQFIKHVWPEVRRRVPEAELDIVGNVCDTLPDDLEGVIKHGFVPSLRPLYEHAALIINPALYGTGLKIKSIEAIAYGKCLVATEAGLQGVPEDAPCIYADLQQMAKGIVTLLKHPEKRMEIEEQAFAYAEQHFTAKAIYEELMQTIETGADGKPSLKVVAS